MHGVIFLISFVFYTIFRRYSKDVPKRKAIMYTLYLVASLYIVRYIMSRDTYVELPKSKFYEMSSTSYHPDSL